MWQGITYDNHALSCSGTKLLCVLPPPPSLLSSLGENMSLAFNRQPCLEWLLWRTWSHGLLEMKEQAELAQLLLAAPGITWSRE